MIKETIRKIVEGIDLSEEESQKAFNEIMSGNATHAQIGSFLTGLRVKGETVDEITGAAKIMRKMASNINVTGEDKTNNEIVVDTCGTGGSGTNIFNVSTASAFVIAGCGVKVAKHGNRSVSSQCGSADVIECLGVNLELSPGQVAECIKKIGIGFLYAPAFHSAMKNAIGPRREIGIRTIFNIVGPLTNPAGANVQVLGVYNDNLTEVLANVLKKLGSKHAFVVHGEDGLDEVTITGRTKISELKNNEVKTFYIEPDDFGIASSSLSDIKGGNIEENTKIILDVLKGAKGPKRDMVLINASLALIAAAKAKKFKEAVLLAKESIDSGKALEKLNQLKKHTNNI